MNILVQNCFHWIGYHYVNFLLEEGMVVKGVDKINTNKKENLYMFVGRNSSFELIDSSNQNEEIDAILIIGDIDYTEKIYCNRIIHILVGNSSKSLPNSIVINPPLLFGEWMEMNEKGFYVTDRFISFDSEEFRNEAVHILDFIQATYRLFNATVVSQRVDVFSKKIFLNDAVKLENSICIRDNIPIEENMRKVIEHYRRHQQLY